MPRSCIAGFLAVSLFSNTPALAQTTLRTELTRGLQSGQFASELQRAGVSPAEVELRLAAMTDAELQQIQQGVHRQAGGEVIVISATALLIGLLIFLILR